MQHLLHKYANGTASRQEQTQVELFFKIYEEEAKAVGYGNLEGNIETLKLEIMHGVLEKHAASKRRVISLSMVWRVAASVLLLIVAGYFAFQWQFQNDSELMAIKDLSPGHEKATLELANGVQILLDTAHNGTIPQQGNTQVSYDGGHLAYLANGTADSLLYNTISTARGGRYNVTLADGTRVWLNAESSLNYPTAFAANVRDVVLTGEAYFEVAKDKQKPFRVLVDEMTVEVLGTHFNINAYEEEGEVRTSLVEGSVRVTSAVEEQLLTPGQQARLVEDGRISLAEGGEVISQALAWKDGMFRFEEADIYSIMRQVGRWYDADIQYEGDMQELYFAIDISRRDNVSTLLSSMELTELVHFEILEDKKQNRIILVKEGRRP